LFPYAGVLPSVAAPVLVLNAASFLLVSCSGSAHDSQLFSFVISSLRSFYHHRSSHLILWISCPDFRSRAYSCARVLSMPDLVVVPPQKRCAKDSAVARLVSVI
jgi:hypothetical protein